MGASLEAGAVGELLQESREEGEIIEKERKGNIAKIPQA